MELLKVGTLGLRSTIESALILAIVTNTKAIKTKASFQTFEAMDIWRYNIFSGHSFSRLLGSGFFWVN